ncbi:hypothetical protein HRI_001507000 [Hibiscus trionum]|uniref:Uncharacterized protein n=1 Tax=Hibiscus trionum TaxID=183268 RepID=A0A9W7LUS3_HIBTR|nr:hypothetical protein HRI_001507000 [Hibiscus trionum]
MDHYNKFKMEDVEYGQYFNNLEQFGYSPDGDADEEEELKKNPEYNYFLENLKLDENGESYSIELPINSDISIVLRYDGREEESFANVDRLRNFKSNSSTEKAKVPENSGGFPGKARTDTPRTVTKPLESGDYGSKKRSTDVPGQKRKRDDKNELGEGAEADAVYCKSSGGSSKSMNCVVKDESGVKSPDSFDKSGMNTEPGDEKGHKSTLHKNDESCPEVEIFTMDNMPLHGGDYSPFVSSKCYHPLAAEECGDGIRGSSSSRFREKLMDLLKVPYNGQEFDNLWLEVTKRKPVLGVKELRHGRMKSYSTKTEGKSYLDWYKDLRLKVEEFRHDRHKVLYLLRGFFFWLENTAHEGAFQPWLDSLYLKGL